MDDPDSSIFALLAESDGDDGAGVHAYRELPPQHVWSENALVDAWTAAMHEFKSYASSSTPSTLDREAQLLASPLWYAPPCPAPSSSTSKPAKRTLAAVVDDDEQEDEDDGDEELEEVPFGEGIQEPEVYEYVATEPHPKKLQRDSRAAAGHVHPSRLDHVQHAEPYFDPAEWEPVSSSSTSAAVVSSLPDGSEVDTAILAIPDPPPLGQPTPQEQALLDCQSPQEALEKALQAWYTAGYAAALYHVRSGAVKP